MNRFKVDDEVRVTSAYVNQYERKYSGTSAIQPSDILKVEQVLKDKENKYCYRIGNGRGAIVTENYLIPLLPKGV